MPWVGEKLDAIQSETVCIPFAWTPPEHVRILFVDHTVDHSDVQKIEKTDNF